MIIIQISDWVFNHLKEPEKRRRTTHKQQCEEKKTKNISEEAARAHSLVRPLARPFTQAVAAAAGNVIGKPSSAGHS